MAVVAVMVSTAVPAQSSDPSYPVYDVGSTAPPEVTADIEALIGEFAGRWSSPEWRTVLELWDPGEEAPYYLFSHQADWLIGWEQLNGYFAKKQTVPVKEIPEQGKWSLTAYVRNLTDDDTPVSSMAFNNFAINPIFTTPGAPNDSTNSAVYPRLYSVIPRRGRDYGLEFRYRFGQ